MVANKEKLRSYLESENLTAQDFARRLGVEQSEADKLLSGERVGYDTARKFIYYFNGVIARITSTGTRPKRKIRCRKNRMILIRKVKAKKLRRMRYE